MSATPQRKESLPLQIAPLTGNQLGVKRVGLLDHSFYFLMSLLVRDLVVMKRVHRVYVYAIPVLALGQTATIQLFETSWTPWTRIARMLLG